MTLYLKHVRYVILTLTRFLWAAVRNLVRSAPRCAEAVLLEIIAQLVWMVLCWPTEHVPSVMILRLNK